MKQRKIQLPTCVMRKVMHKELQDKPITSGCEYYLCTGAKGYYLGGGWWLVSGYSHDGSDVEEVLDHLDMFLEDYEMGKHMRNVMDAEEYHFNMSGGDIGGIAAR